MLGSFQQSTLRLEVDAQAEALRRCLTEAELLRQWMWPQQLEPGIPEQLEVGVIFESHVGLLTTGHRVDHCGEGRLQVVMWGAMDGLSEWVWGNGWAQLRVEAISLLPVAAGVWLSLRQLQRFAPQVRIPGPESPVVPAVSAPDNS